MNSRSIYKMLTSRTAVSLGASAITGVLGALNGAITSQTFLEVFHPAPTSDDLSEAATMGALGVGLVSVVGGYALAVNAADGKLGNFENMQKNKLKYLNPLKYGFWKGWNDLVSTHSTYVGTHFLGGLAASTLLKFLTDLSVTQMMTRMLIGSSLTGLFLAAPTAVAIAALLSYINDAYQQPAPVCPENDEEYRRPLLH